MITKKIQQQVKEIISEIELFSFVIGMYYSGYPAFIQMLVKKQPPRAMSDIFDYDNLSYFLMIYCIIKLLGILTNSIVNQSVKEQAI